MPLSSTQIVTARSWIGSTEDESVFSERYDRLAPQANGDDALALDLAIEESLRSQLLSMVIDQPSSMELQGVGSLSFTENIKALRELYSSFVAQRGLSGLLVVDGSGLRLGRLKRTSVR